MNSENPTEVDDEDRSPEERAKEFIKQVAEQRQNQLSERELKAGRARVRHKYWLLEKWKTALAEYDGPGEAKLIDGYRPSGFRAPIDVPEIAGLIVWDTEDHAHHFRLYRDETISFLKFLEDPNSRITIDPMRDPYPDNTVYQTNGPPSAVIQRLDALELAPRWEDACRDGEHEFERVDKGPPGGQLVRCKHCQKSISTLSWMGHQIPADVPTEESNHSESKHWTIR